jgi:hypothetical protein
MGSWLMPFMKSHQSQSVFSIRFVLLIKFSRLRRERLPLDRLRRDSLNLSDRAIANAKPIDTARIVIDICAIKV